MGGFMEIYTYVYIFIHIYIYVCVYIFIFVFVFICEIILVFVCLRLLADPAGSWLAVGIDCDSASYLFCFRWEDWQMQDTVGIH